MKLLLSLLFSAVFGIAYGQQSTVVTLTSILRNSAEIRINRCLDSSSSTPKLNRIVIQPELSAKELSLVQEMGSTARNSLMHPVFVDTTFSLFPLTLNVQYPDLGFYVIGFSNYSNFMSSKLLKPKEDGLITICEKDFFAFLEEQESVFTDLISSKIDTIAISFYQSSALFLKEKWSLTKAENAITVKRMVYTNKTNEVQHSDNYTISPENFNKLVQLEAALKQNIHVNTKGNTKHRKEQINIHAGEFSNMLSLTGDKDEFYNQFLELLD